MQITRIDLGYTAACGATLGKLESRPAWPAMLRALHSPIRCVWYRVEMEIPSFVSVHFVRHKVGVEHYVMSLRDDGLNADKDRGRESLVRHVMIANAEAMLNIAEKRLCQKAHAETRDVMRQILREMSSVDLDLYRAMRPRCEILRDGCPELRPCNRKLRGVLSSTPVVR